MSAQVFNLLNAHAEIQYIKKNYKKTHFKILFKVNFIHYMHRINKISIILTKNNFKLIIFKFNL
jgi:hypothetical protein